MLAAALYAAPAAGAQRGTPRLYDTATVRQVTGTVVAVDSIASTRGPSAVITLRLASGADTVTVHVGPAWYLARHQFRINAGDHLAVTGSRVTLDGAVVMIAAEVAKGDQTIRLRDRTGLPVWRQRS